MKTLIQKFRTFARDESGAAAVEYGLLASLIALAIVGAVTLLGTELSGVFNSVKTAIKP